MISMDYFACYVEVEEEGYLSDEAPVLQSSSETNVRISSEGYFSDNCCIREEEEGYLSDDDAFGKSDGYYLSDDDYAFQNIEKSKSLDEDKGRRTSFPLSNHEEGVFNGLVPPGRPNHRLQVPRGRFRKRAISSHKREKFSGGALDTAREKLKPYKLPISLYIRPSTDETNTIWNNMSQKWKKAYGCKKNFRKQAKFCAELILLAHPFTLVRFTKVPESEVTRLMGDNANHPLVWQSLSAAACVVKQRNSAKPDFEWRLCTDTPGGNSSVAIPMSCFSNWKKKRKYMNGESRKVPEIKFHDIHNSIDLTTNASLETLFCANTSNFSNLRKLAYSNMLRKCLGYATKKTSGAASLEQHQQYGGRDSLRRSCAGAGDMGFGKGETSNIPKQRRAVVTSTRDNEKKNKTRKRKRDRHVKIPTLEREVAYTTTHATGLVEVLRQGGSVQQTKEKLELSAINDLIRSNIMKTM
jgi:hypothetical protein